MKYRYGFSTGTETVEIPEEWAAVLEEMDHEEQLCARRERRRHQSLDALLYEGMDFAGDGDAETPLLENELSGELEEALEKLTEIQRRRLLMHCEGMTYREMGRLEDANMKSCEESVKGAIRKIQKNLEEI